MGPDLAVQATAVRDFLHRLVDADQPGTRPPRFDAVAEDLDVVPGLPVMVAMPNGTEFVAVVLALLVRGAVPVLMPPAAPPSRIERMGQALGANVLITPRLPSGLSTVDTRVVGGVAELGVLPGSAPRARQPGEIILLTSGTSGVFSGCLHRVESLLRNGARHA